MIPSASRDAPFLWLEEIEGARALEWVRGQNERSLAVLEGDARFTELRAQALAIAENRDRLPTGQVRGGYYYNFWQDDRNVRGLWRRSPLEAYRRGQPQWETLIDLDALSAAESANWVWKGVQCTPDNSRCMISLSNGGLDAATWREFDMATRAFVPGGFMVPEAKSSLVWRDNDTLLVATNWGEGTLTESGYPFIVREWRRGTPLAEAREIMRGQRTDVGVFMAAADDEEGRRTVFAVEADTFFEAVNWIVAADAAPQRVTLPAKATIRGIHKGQIIATLEEAWSVGGQTYPQGALIAYPLEDAGSAAPRVQVLYGPGPRESIEDVVITRDAVLVAGFRNVRGRVLRFAFDGRAWLESEMPIPSTGSVGFAGADPTQSTAFAIFEDYLTPDTLYALNVRAGSAAPVRAMPALFNGAGMVSEQFEATSRDGARVPYTIVRRADAPMDGSNPTLLYGYGGFQVSYPPTYNPFVGRMWLERGGIYVMANIRGGGEFGPAWHQAGLRTNRQVVYDDFIAIAEDLISRRITSPRRLGIMGGSNGGLLMGVMLTQRPELFRAAVVQVPLLDMLRFDRLLAGASWVDEYGSPANPEERRFLERISPLQNLRRNPNFPVPFFVTSTKDDRVHPGHARRYAARMEELGMPFLYYENTDGGHSAAANQREVARRRALEFTYLAQRLID